MTSGIDIRELERAIKQLDANLEDNQKWLLKKITVLERRIFDLEKGYKP